MTAAPKKRYSKIAPIRCTGGFYRWGHEMCRRKF